MGSYFDSYDPNAYLAQKQQEQQAQPTTKQGFNATSLIPAAAAALSFIPGIGTVASGALGAGGEALREKLNGENFDLAKIGTEGAISAVPFALGRAAKLGVGAIKAAHGISAVEGIAKAGNAVADVGRAAKAVATSDRGAALGDVVGQLPKAAPAATAVAPAAVDAGAAAVTAAPTSLLGKIQQSGRDLAASARGITPGAKVAGQDQLGVQGADDLNTFLNTAGVKGTSAKQQLADLEAKHAGWGKAIGDTIEQNNRPLAPSDLTNMKSRIDSRVGQILGLPKTGGEVALVGPDGKALIESPGVANHPYLASLTQDLGKVTDLKSANAFRQRLDQDAINYGRNSNAPDPVKEQIAKAFRGGIDDYVGEAIPTLKPVQNLYSQGADAQDFLKNAAKNPAGVSIPLLGRAVGNIGGDAIQAGKAKLGDVMAGGTPAADGAVAGTGSSLFSKIKTGVGGTIDAGKSFGAQAGSRLLLDAAGVPVPSADHMTHTVTTPSTTDPSALGATDPTATGAGAAGTGIDYNAEADKILNSGADAKTQSAQLDLLAKRQALEAAVGKASGSGGKSLSVPANELIGNTASGLNAIAQLRSELGKDPNVANKDAAAGVAGNLGRGVAGTQTFNTARQEIIDVLSRLRTGAAISASEEKLYKGQLPAAFDSPDQIQYKLGLYQHLFEGLASRAQGGSPTLEAAGLTAN